MPVRRSPFLPSPFRHPRTSSDERVKRLRVTWRLHGAPFSRLSTPKFLRVGLPLQHSEPSRDVSEKCCDDRDCCNRPCSGRQSPRHKTLALCASARSVCDLSSGSSIQRPGSAIHLAPNFQLTFPPLLPQQPQQRQLQQQVCSTIQKK